jgi:hypothetical protein
VFQWIPPPPPEKMRDAEEQISIDLGDEYEQALTGASQEEIIDLAGQYHIHNYSICGLYKYNVLDLLVIIAFHLLAFQLSLSNKGKEI